MEIKIEKQGKSYIATVTDSKIFIIKERDRKEFRKKLYILLDSLI